MSFETLFDIQRIWNVWPNLTHQQVLRELFREASSGGDEISGVYVIPGHIFVSTVTTAPDNKEAQGKLYAFSCIPLGEGSRLRDSHETGCILRLSGGRGRVVSITDRSSNQSNTQHIYVVQDNGELSVLQYDCKHYKWEVKESHRISHTTLQSCVIHSTPTSNTFSLLYCEFQPNTDGLYSSQIASRSCDITTDGRLTLSEPTLLLTHSPPMELLLFQHGVCFIPREGPYPDGLLLMWCQSGEMKRDVMSLKSSKLRVFVWNSTCMLPSLEQVVGRDDGDTSFKTIVLRLAGIWNKAPKDPCLVTMTTHPVTNQLLALAGDGTVYDIIVSNNSSKVHRKPLTKLSDFSQRYSTVSGLFSFPPSLASMKLFNIHTFYGICFKGELRVYDSFTGEFVWECDEHEGTGTQLWTTPTLPGCCGLHGNSGIWIMRSRKAADYAYFIANALFPVTTNADETTPGAYLENGQILAAKLCKLWGLELLSTKYALEAGYDLLKPKKKGKKKTSEISSPELGKELTELLGKDSSLQNPGLLVALLVENPSYRVQLSECVSQFLEDFHSNAPQQPTNNKLTPLNIEIAPLLEKYLELSKQVEQLLSQKELPGSDYAPSVRGLVCELLQQTEQAVLTIDEDAVRSQLHSMCEDHPEEALLGIKDFLKVDTFEEAIKQIQAGSWESKRNWKGIFATETVRGVQNSYIQPKSHFPLFEQTCRLLYHTQPDQLMTFVTFAQLARDYQGLEDSAFARKCRKDFFFQRALDALSVSQPPRGGAPVRTEAVRVHCQLLLQSTYPNSEMQCLQLLLSNSMWSEAISLVQETKQEENHCALFHCLLTHLAKARVLECYIDEVWQLLPEQFSVFDFLSLLKLGRRRDSPGVIVPSTHHELTVSSVAPKLLDLLKQTRLDNRT